MTLKTKVNKIDNKIIDYVYDKSKFKQNKYTPGTHIKIIDPKKINVIKNVSKY